MPRYTPDSKDRVRDAVDMIALVSARTELRRAGVNSYFGRCPFHDERTGSFHVRPEEKHYHCFGCQQSGDPFDFVMETEGLDFKAAMESLADRFGITLEVEDEDPAAAAARQRRERLHALLDRAAGYYARVLWESKEAAGARAYLAGRGLNEETLKTYRVGYAPSAWDRMLLASRQAGFSEEELVATGLAQRSTKGRSGVYDRFRERIMFPLADARGRVVGFGARAMRDNQPPKYLNTSEGEVFHKGSQLFGIDLARKHAARAGSVVLAEGYTDVLALHQAGLQNVVGIMGTSLTDEQARELERTARTLVLALDADSAGKEAMLRAARIAAGRSMELRVAPLPPGADPADLVQRDGAEAVREQIGRSVPFATFHVDRILEVAEKGDAEGKDRALAEIGPILREFVSDPLKATLRDDIVQRVTSRLAVPAPVLETHVQASAVPAAVAPRVEGQGGAGRAVAAAPPRAPDNGSVARQLLGRREQAERTFLALCVAFPAEGAEVLKRIDLEAHFTTDLLRRAAQHLDGRLATPLEDPPRYDSELMQVVSEIAARSVREGVTPMNLEHAWLTLELSRLDRAIGTAQTAQTGDVGTLSREREQIRTAVRALSGRLQER